jgi:hypothetical protein
MKRAPATPPAVQPKRWPKTGIQITIGGDGDGRPGAWFNYGYQMGARHYADPAEMARENLDWCAKRRAQLQAQIEELGKVERHLLGLLPPAGDTR